MGSSSGMLKLATCVVLIACMVVTAPRAQAAVSCGLVMTSLAPCLGYLRTGGQIPANCCNGVKALYNAARTPTDRQEACKCMKSASAAVSGLDLSLAAGLPSKCGLNLPYKIAPTTDCSKVQ